MKKMWIFILILTASFMHAQAVQVNIDAKVKYQIIDGFGAHQGNNDENQNWWLDLYYNDMECSILRVDLTPNLISPYSDLRYYSPWFMGSQTKSVFNFEDPANPNGPENNRVRTYTGPQDYSRIFGGRNAPIAVMGPDIERNVLLFSYSASKAIDQGNLQSKALGDFKLIGSVWSPLPWVKMSSGNVYKENWWPGPVANTAWPFIWGGNFSGGRLDVSNTALSVFDDKALGGTGPTSAITQFARSTAAYILGYQRFHKSNFYAISIQNELNFEEFYSSCTYPLSSQYISAVKAVRKEFDKYPELQHIKIMGPEDLLGGDAYGLWEYGGPVHKNLQYLKNIENDNEASKAVAFYCIHGYANDGVTAAGANPREWDWWANGWSASPAAGIPANVKGFKSFNKKSWMTETSGENREWLFPKNAFPGDGALGVALRIHQALSTGQQSAWAYWTFADSDGSNVSNYGLTNEAAGKLSPKYVAAKHYFKYIRPNTYRIMAASSVPAILTSAYYNDSTKVITVVCINSSSSAQTCDLNLNFQDMTFDVFTSFENNYWNKSTSLLKNGKTNVNLPPYAVTTLTGKIKNTKVDQNSQDALFAEIRMLNNKQQSIFVATNNNSPIYINCIDHYGQIIYKKMYPGLNSGIHQITIENQAFPQGIYYYKITNNNNSYLLKSIIY